MEGIIVKKLLQTLTETFGPSGYEDNVRAIVRNEVEPLADEIRDGLLTGSGDTGMVLNSVLSYEQARWDNARPPGITEDTLRDAYVHSLAWADGLIRSFN